MDGKNEDTDITPHPHSDTYFSTLAPNWGQRPIFFCDTIKVYSLARLRPMQAHPS